MGDSNFHIVQQSDGQFEIVKLAPIVKKIVHPKIGTEIVEIPGGDCKNGANSNAENELSVIKKIEEGEHQRILRTYSRIRKEQIKDPAANVVKNQRVLIHKENVTSVQTITKPTTFVSSIKIGPAIDNRREAKKDKMVQRLQPIGKHAVYGNKSIKVDQKVSSAPATSVYADSDATTFIANENTALLKLAQQNVKCNICGMTFERAYDQINTLKNHFMQHKTSVVKVVRKSKRYRLDKFDDKCTNPIKSPAKKPVILNNTIRCLNTELKKNVPVKTYVLHPGPKNSENSHFRIAASQEKLSIGANSSGALKQRILINVKPISRHLLDKLRSLDQLDKKKIGKSNLVIGNTIIKPVKHKHGDVTESSKPEVRMESCEGKRTNETMIAHVEDDNDDDDVEVVEQKPELIVIDDNDEEEL